MDKIYKDYIHKNEIELHNINDKTISLEIARIRVARWLETVGAMPELKGDHNAIPRAIFISMDDIAQLQHAYPAASGIRVYFGLSGELEPREPSITDLDGILIPVMLLPDSSKSAEPADDDNTGTDTLLVYDFTTPCPPVCNKSSELYVPFPKSD